MDTEGAKLVTPTRHTCALCKQTNLRSAHQCNGCGQLFHKACLLKNHKYVNELGEQIECVGHEIPDNASVASSASSILRKKRKRYEEESDVNDIADKVDMLVDRVEEIGVNVVEFRNEFRNIATEIFLDFKDVLVAQAREVVKEELREVVKELVELKKVISGNSDGKTEQVKKTNEKLLYAEKVKNSITETVVVEPKEKQDSRTTFTEVKSKVKIGKLGVGVEKLKKTQSGKVVIGCVGKEDREKLASELKKNIPLKSWHGSVILEKND